MKKLLLLVLTALVMVGCVDQNELASYIDEDYFAVVTYDSCEYVIGNHGYQGFLAHKGNCKYCEARRKQELKELIEQLKK